MTKSIPQLIDAVCRAYSNALPGQKWSPNYFEGQLRTYCNEAVNYISCQIGYTRFDNPKTTNPDDAMLANVMFDVMNDTSGDWISVAGSVAQADANVGILVVAGEKDLYGHGHVCVVIPGEMEDSVSWRKKAPKVMNVGRDVFIGKKASFAFRKEPLFFALKGMI